MPLNLKSTKHWLTTRHGLAESTEETVVFLGRQNLQDETPISGFNLRASSGTADQALMVMDPPTS